MIGLATFPRTDLMKEYTELAKELIREDDGADHQALVIRNRVFSPHQFDESLPDFSSRQYVFLNAFRYGVPFEEACAKAGMTAEQADRFLRKEKVRKWLADRALKDHIKQEWEEPGKWYAEGEKLFNQERVSRHKVEVWKAFGERVAPVKKQEKESGTKIEINIDPGAVEEAFRRKNAIDAQIA